MNQPIDSARLLSKFVAYQLAIESARLVDVACRQWQGRSDLANQARRSSASVPLNLAEGNDELTGSDERRRFQRYALRSARETWAALDLARSIGLGDHRELEEALAMASRVVAITVALVRRR